MENLNAEQVKKALEKVEDTYIYLYRGTDGLWHEVRYSHILALITSQEQRIGELEAECKKWQDRLKIECEYTERITVRKMHSEIKERCIKGGIYPAFVASTIDQIAKEMLEGENEN